MKFLYKYILTLFLIFGFNQNLNAGTGAATTYKLTITLLELCDSTSSLSVCNNPVVIGTGDSGAIDIAGTTAGEAAASYGSLGSVPFGTTYTHMQVTMNRAITASGSAKDGAGTLCYTDGSATGSATSNASGNATAAASTTLYLGLIGTANGNATNSATASDGSGTSRSAGTVTSGDEFLEFRITLESSLTLKTGSFPTVKVAFGTSTAITAVGNMGAACGTGSAAAGLLGSAPDVTVSFE